MSGTAATVKQIRQMRVKHGVIQDCFIEKAQCRMSEVCENRAAEKVQEQEAPGAEHSHPVYKGFVEPIFALANNKLLNRSALLPSFSNKDTIALTSRENPDVKPAD